MQVWSICTVACAQKWDYSLNEWCRLPKANKSVITCLGLWWQSLCWWHLSENEAGRITFTFHLALAWSPLHRGHLGRNATILPVIKLLIQPHCADFHLIFQSIHGHISLHFIHCIIATHSVRKQRWETFVGSFMAEKSKRLQLPVIQLFVFYMLKEKGFW